MALRSLVAVASAAIAILGACAAAVGLVGIHLGALSPISGFQLFLLGTLPGGALALLLGLIGLLRTRASTGRAGRSRAWIGTLGGLAMLAIVLGAASSGRGAPAIHDISTDPSDPPQFSGVVATAADRQNGVDYPDGGPEVPAQQRKAYPDLEPIRLDLPPREALARARAAAESLGWNVTTVDPAAGRIEATHTSRVFLFVDDIVVRVRADGSASRIDVRSNSRVGQSDLGANAARIRAFGAGLRKPAT